MKHRNAMLVLLASCLASTGSAQDVAIRIVGATVPTMKFIKVGDTEPLPVTVKVGQTVRWSNETTLTHTATSVKKGPDGKRIFNTENVAPVDGHVDVLFDSAKFTAAGGQPGGSVDLDYFCIYHTAMKGKIVLIDAGSASRPPLRVRKNVKDLTEDEVKSLRAGVAAMRARPFTDRTSWEYWAAIHGTLADTTDPVLNQCRHGTIDFFVWHRAYLHHFEQVLRAASGDPALTLPYWNWSEQRSLPEIYRLPADPQTNSLYDAHRQFNNPAFAMPVQLVVNNLDTAIQQIEYFKASRPWPDRGFSGNIDRTPHGDVHVYVGGADGTMSAVETSALDPVFWAHHANVDRQWDLWLAKNNGRMNPTDPAFLAAVFTFPGTNGVDVTMTAQAALSSEGLGYRYADEMPPLSVIASSVPSVRAGVAEPPIKLGLDPVDVKLEASAGPGALMSAMREANPAAVRRIIVRVRDVSFAATPAFVYGVYLELPPGTTDPAKLEEHFVGSMSFFARGETHGRGATRGRTTFTETFDVTPVIARLRAAGVAVGEKPVVTVRPILPEVAPGHEAELRTASVAAVDASSVTVASVDLVLTNR